MRERITAVLAYIGAGLTLIVAALVPFVLMGAFSHLVAHAGLRVDAAYSGGTIARTIERKGYQIAVYQPVKPHLLQRVEPFVQIAFKPAATLPPRVDDAVDLDGDGKPDVQIKFAMPVTAQAPLSGDVVALNDGYQSLSNVGGDSFSRLLVRSGDQIVVRVPLSRASARR